jgi:hypothetical protein
LTKAQHCYRENFTLTEAIGKNGTVDRAAGVIRGVKMLGFASRNRRGYNPPDPKVFEGVKARINHYMQEGEVDPPDPQVDNIWGWYEGVETKQDGVYGNLKYNPKHALTETILWWIENRPEIMGLSPIMFCERDEIAGTTILTVRLVESCDLVDRSGTTGGMFESVQTRKESDMELKEALEALAKANADLGTARVTIETNKGTITALETENKSLKATVSEGAGKLVAAQESLRLANVAGTRLKLLADNGLDKADAKFIEAVKTAATDDLATALIETVKGARALVIASGSSPADAGAGKQVVESLADAEKRGLLKVTD